jgi:hypothetical protein
MTVAHMPRHGASSRGEELQVPSTDAALRSLSRCDELRHLYLERVSCDWSCLAAAAAADTPLASGTRHAGGSACSYLVFRRLPALLDCGVRE